MPEAQRPDEGIGFPGTVVSDGCVDSEDQTQVSTRATTHLITEASL